MRIANWQSYSWERLVEGELMFKPMVWNWVQGKERTENPLIVGLKKGGKKFIKVGGDRAQVYGVGKVGPP
ncbi:hypothetical protein Tco_0901403 [Tanacetum coccineum]